MAKEDIEQRSLFQNKNRWVEQEDPKKETAIIWIGHLFRLPEDAPAKQALAEGIRKVKRPRGKPKTIRGLALFKMKLHELNLTLENAKEIAQERPKWTDIVDGAISNNWWKASMMMMMI